MLVLYDFKAGGLKIEKYFLPRSVIVLVHIARRLRSGSE
jgi:hypothetical protein